MKYIRQTEDIIACPSDKCSYAGFVSKRVCSTPLKCEACSHEWRDPASYSLWERMTTHRSKGGGETLSNLQKVMFTVGCPSCGMFIYKDGGCQYMRCSKCQYEFCWFCQQSYKGYHHQNPGYMCP